MDPALVLSRAEPGRIAGGRPASVVLHGEGLEGVEVRAGGELVLVREAAKERLGIELGPQRRGVVELVALRGARRSNALGLVVDNSPPEVRDPGTLAAAAGQRIQHGFEVFDFDGDEVRVELAGEVPGAALEGELLSFAPPATATPAVYRSMLVLDDGFEQVTLALAFEVLRDAPPLVLERLEPERAPGGQPLSLIVHGGGFDADTQVLVDDAEMPTRMIAVDQLEAQVPPLRRGNHRVSVRRDGEPTAPLGLRIGNTPPAIVAPRDVAVAEEEPLVLEIAVDDFDGDSVRLAAEGLPPGAWLDEASRTLRFTPDFIQGGATHEVTLVARDGIAESRVPLELVILDTIQPPPPRVLATERSGDRRIFTLEQVVDGYLDSPGRSGRTYRAFVSVPLEATPQDRVPVRIALHGFGGGATSGGSAAEIRISPSDPDNAYWWGYAESLPAAPTGRTQPYVLRRVLHLLEWVLRTFPGADPERVYAAGGSMGGAGAATLGLLHARHFALVEATIGQMIPRNHRPSRQSQLRTLWGAPGSDTPDAGGLSAWDRMDLVRALIQDRAARDQFLSTKHGKDDPTIHFGAVVLPSPLVERSYYQAVQSERIGHYAVWDEGGHGSTDPVLGSAWWDAGWSRIRHPEAYLHRGTAFPAFTRSSWDSDPGDGTGNGRQSWSNERGFAGNRDVAGDTGWSGDLAGALNRGLRWDAAAIVDTWERLEIPLRVVVGSTTPPPRAGYPARGDAQVGPLPVVVDVTPRRAQRFVLMPGETVTWSFGEARGTAEAGWDGAVTVERLEVGLEVQTLVLER